MDSTVIVALPSLDDKVYKISSEQVPHLTLISLGDLSDNEEALTKIVEFVDHAAEQLDPFGLQVDHRGILGEKGADVLFFEDNAWGLDRVKEFRAHLLANDAINRGFLTSDQFPEWTPHLTLGFPETPAHPDTSEYPGIHYVNFDRIAVWMGSYQGPEFRLKQLNDALEVSMSDMTTAKRGEQAISELFHYGKKGMKWGVRNDKGHEGERVKTKKLDKLDKQWEKENTGQAAYMKAYNAAANKMNNGEIDRINNKPEYKDANFNNMDDPLTKAYFKEHETVFHNAMVDSWAAAGTNPSGRKRFEIQEVEDPETGEMYRDVFLAPVKDKVKHAEGDTEIWFRLTRDADGLVTKYVAEERELKHFGVKGMKWGVRNTDGGKSRGTIKRGLTKANVALDAGSKVIEEGEKKLIFLPKENRAKAASATQTRVLSQAAKINESPQFSGKDLKGNAPLRDAYFKKVEAEAKVIYAEELGIARAEALGSFLRSVTNSNRTQVRISADSNRIRHADEEDHVTLLELNFELDALGQISGVNVPEQYLKHGEDLELVHYGVKGMKWGVTSVDRASQPTLTREKKALRDSKDVTVTQRKAGKYVKTRGGQRQKAADDAVKAAAARQKAKKSTTDSLTNDELKAAVERMNLEQQYAKLNAKTKRRGQGFVSQLFQNADARAASADLAKRVAVANA